MNILLQNINVANFSTNRFHPVSLFKREAKPILTVVSPESILVPLMISMVSTVKPQPQHR